jgi:outer membrane protein
MLSKYFVRAMVVCCVGLVSLGTAAAQSKIGIIDLQKAMLETAELKKAQADMEAKYKPRQEEITKLQQDLQSIQAQMSSGKLSQEGYLDAQSRGQRDQRDIQRKTDDLQSDVQQERNEVLQHAGQQMKGIVRQIAEAKGLDVVIDVTNTFYYKPALDITEEAVAAFDKAYPVK